VRVRHSAAWPPRAEVSGRAGLVRASAFLPGSTEISVVSLEMVPNFRCAESEDDFYRDGLWLEIYFEEVKNQAISLAPTYPDCVVVPSPLSSSGVHWCFQSVRRASPGLVLPERQADQRFLPL